MLLKFRGRDKEVEIEPTDVTHIELVEQKVDYRLPIMRYAGQLSSHASLPVKIAPIPMLTCRNLVGNLRYQKLIGPY